VSFQNLPIEPFGPGPGFSAWTPHREGTLLHGQELALQNYLKPLKDLKVKRQAHGFQGVHLPPDHSFGLGDQETLAMLAGCDGLQPLFT